MNKYKIVHVVTEIYNYQIGGIATVASCLHRNKNKNELFVFVCKDRTKIARLPKDIFVIDKEHFLEDIKKVSFNKIIFHNFILCSMYVNAFKNIKNVYYVIHSNIVKEVSYEVNTMGENEVKAFRNAVAKSTCICISKYEKELLMETTNKDPKEIKVIYNGYSFNDIGYDYIKNEKIPNTFGYIGRIDERKGFHLLCKTFKSIPEYNLYLAAGGKATYSQPFLDDCIQYMSENIIPLGFCKDMRKTAFFDSIEALIVPSLYEPFGMVLLEAIDRGTPILCNKQGGMIEILGEDYPFYFDINDEESLKECINKFKSYTDEEITELLNTLKVDSMYRFSTDNMIKKYRKV